MLLGIGVDEEFCTGADKCEFDGLSNLRIVPVDDGEAVSLFYVRSATMRMPSSATIRSRTGIRIVQGVRNCPWLRKLACIAFTAEESQTRRQPGCCFTLLRAASTGIGGYRAASAPTWLPAVGG